MTIYTTLRGRRVQADVTLSPSEPSVGIMSAYVEEYDLTDEETGDVLDWELDDDELAKLAGKVEDTMWSDR